MALVLYFALLAAWPLLIWPALHLGGRSRVWLGLVILVGLLATTHEVRMFAGPPSAIRLDILLIAIALVGLYASAAAVLYARQWRKLATLFAVLPAIAGGGMTYSWVEAGRESARLTATFQARNALLFEAKFRSLDAYTDYFGMFDARPTIMPVGHWAADGGGYFSRLIVNPEGRAWAFFRCGDTECTYQSVEPGVRPVDDPAKRRWDVTLTAPAGLPVTVQITQIDPDRLQIEGRGAPSMLTKIAPPIDPAPAPRSLIYLGPFSQLDCHEPYADMRQLWLWQEQARVYAVGIFATLLAGRRADFVSPIVLGEGVRDGDTWSFAWHHNGQSWAASVTLTDPAATLTLERDGDRIAQTVLSRAPIFRDEVIELAPLTGKSDWDHWFDIVFTGHFTSGDVPAC